MKKYIAIIDNGSDTIEFRYTSVYRNNSSDNRSDLYKQLVQCYGKHAIRYTVVDTYRSEWDN